MNIIREGKEKEPFKVHKNYICFYSPYFDAAFNGSFSEGQTQELDLEETEPKTFGIFVNWLYTQQIVNEEGAIPRSSTLIDLWILADKILVPSLQNQTLKLLEQCRKEDGRLSSSSFHRAYESTTEDSPLRKYLVCACSHGGLAEIVNVDSYPHQLLVGIVNSMRAASRLPHWMPGEEELSEFFVPDNVERRRLL